MALWDPNTGPSGLDLSGFGDPAPGKPGKGSPGSNAPTDVHGLFDTYSPPPPSSSGSTAPPPSSASSSSTDPTAGGSSVRAVRDRLRHGKATPRTARPTGRPGARGGDQPLSPLGRALVGAVAGGVVARAFEVPGGWATGVVAGGCVGYFIFGEFQWQMP